MKKILGISLVALMSVTAANAEIASKAYVNREDDAVKTLITNEAAARAQADTTITNTIGTVSNLTTTNKVVVPAINELKSTVDGLTSGDGSVETQISSAIGGLDVAEITEAGKVVTAISETDGKVSATLGQITNAEISSTAAIAPSKIATDANNRFVTENEKSTWSAKQDALASTDHKGEVVSLDESTGEVTYLGFDSAPTASSGNLVTSGAVATAIAGANTATTGAIEALDYAGNNAAGVVTQVTEADGVIAVTKAKVTTSEIADDAGIVKNQLANEVKGSLDLADSAVQSVVEGDGNGQIKVDGTNVNVHGLGSAAYENTTAFDAAGTATTEFNKINNATRAAANAGDGTYTLTMKVVDNNPSYVWELIER